MTMIELRHVSKNYENKCILDDLNLRFSEGEINVITGDSGCGKTTLLRVLMGLEEYEGHIHFGDYEPSTSKSSTCGPFIPTASPSMAAVFQEDRLIEHLSALQNIRIVQSKSSTISKSEAEKTILQALKELGLEKDAHTPASELSGGMKRRIAILRALESDARILFFDEALKGLDEQNRERTMRYIRKKIKQRTVFWVTHHFEEIPMLGRCIHYHMDAGRLSEGMGMSLKIEFIPKKN